MNSVFVFTEVRVRFLGDILGAPLGEGGQVFHPFGVTRDLSRLTSLSDEVVQQKQCYLIVLANCCPRSLSLSLSRSLFPSLSLSFPPGLTLLFLHLKKN